METEVKEGREVVYHILKLDGRCIGSISLHKDWMVTPASNQTFIVIRKPIPTKQEPNVQLNLRPIQPPAIKQEEDTVEVEDSDNMSDQDWKPPDRVRCWLHEREMKKE